MSRDFRKSTRTRIDSLDKLGQTVKDEIDLAVVQELLRSNRDRDRETQTKMYKRLRAWLSPVSSTEDDLKSIRKKRHADTCFWIEEEQAVRQYLRKDLDPPMVLWITGLPGSGKTYISAHLIDLLSKKTDYRTAFFFCKTQVEEKRTVLSILRTWTWQLVRGIPPQTAIQFNKYFEQGETLNNDHAMAIIEELHDQSSPLWLIVDGLDECLLDEQATFLNLCTTLTRFCKIAIISRETPAISSGIHDAVDGSFSHVRVTEKATKIDIDRYLSHEVERMVRQSSTLGLDFQEKILTTLCSGAQGMFLWASMMANRLSDLCKHGDEDAVMKALAEYPRNVDDVYKRTMEDIIANKDPILQEKVHKILQWIVCACRPLTITELDIAIRIDPAEPRGIPTIPIVDFKDTLMELCGPFLDIDQRTGTVHFAHASVKDFLLVQELYTNFKIDPKVTQSNIARACLSYLCYPDRTYVHINHDDDDPAATHKFANHLKLGSNLFLEYSTIYWCHHFAEESVPDSPMCVESFRQFAASMDSLTKWLQMCCHLECKNDFIATTEILFSAFHDLDSGQRVLCTALVEGEEPALFTSHLGWAESKRFTRWQRMMQWKWETLRNASVIHVAAYFDFVGLVQQEIIAQPANADMKNVHGFTPLMLAARGGSVETVKCLIMHGASLDLQTKNLKRTALFEALDDLHGQHWSGPGSYEAAELILKAGCDTTVETVDAQNPLHGLINASKDGEAQALMGKELVRHGASLTTFSWHHGPCLCYAVSQDTPRIMKAILDEGQKIHGPDVMKSVINSTFHYGTSLLELAMKEKQHKTCKLLIAAGADINLLSKLYQRPCLNVAVRQMPMLVRDMLLQGANPSAADSEGLQPVHVAAIENLPDTVRTLVEAGADPEARTVNGQTPLDLAESHGSVDARDALLELRKRCPLAGAFTQPNPSMIATIGVVVILSSGFVYFLRTYKKAK